ncbi:cytolethal distending toxin subunit B family protein [Chromobacterium haemolyticum]|nr:cytolethal distending toxin subunit B family protein [Chromobacterium haemolyticum]
MVAVQEAGEPPASSVPVSPTNTVPVNTSNPSSRYAVEQFTWNIGTSARPNQYYIYFVRVSNRVNLATIVRNRPDRVVLLRNPRETQTNHCRPILGLVYGNDVYYNIHAGACGVFNEAPEIIEYIHTYHSVQFPSAQWMVMGDYNRDPASLQQNLPPAVARNTTVISQDSRTQTSGGNLDYAVIGQVNAAQTFSAQALLYIAQLAGQLVSDHTPVKFTKINK